MPKFITRHFGEIDFEESRVVTFPQGIPGFPEDKRFLFMSENEDEDMFFWLQSLDDGDVAVTLMEVYKVMPDYAPCVDEAELDDIRSDDDTPFVIYNIVVIPDYVRQMRVNLRAPIFINMEEGIAKQAICTNDEYPIRFMIVEEFERAGRKFGAGFKDAGSDA